MIIGISLPRMSRHQLYVCMLYSRVFQVPSSERSQPARSSAQTDSDPAETAQSQWFSPARNLTSPPLAKSSVNYNQQNYNCRNILEWFEVSMEDMGFLGVQEVHALCDVESHLETLLPRELYLLLLMQQCKEGPSMTKFCHNQHMSFLCTIRGLDGWRVPRAHEEDKVWMSNLSECADLSFKLFECVICALRHDSKFLYGDISLLVCPLVHLSTGPRANLLLNLQII